MSVFTATLSPNSAPSVDGAVHRDPQRRFSEPQRRALYTRQDGACHRCTDPLPTDFHAHHVVPWAAGGPTHLDNGVAVCPDCHLHAATHPLPDLMPRTWQVEALAAALPVLLAGQFATVAVAPGGGKTRLAAMLAQELLGRGAVDRVVVFVPNGNLRRQWVTELGRVGLHLEADPRYLRESPAAVGAVYTYAKLTPANVAHLRADDRPTLVICDEVHHLGRDEDGGHRSWSLAIADLVGTVEAPTQPVLNLTGTPFRSGRGERIGTCRYRATDADALQLVTDYQVHSNELIAAGHLRHLQVHSMDAALQVLDLRDGEVSDNRVVDLDGVAASVRTASLRVLLTDVDRFIGPVLDALVAILAMQQHALDGHPVKGLIVCDSVRQADLVHATATDRLHLPSGRLLKATSDDGAEAVTAIEEFRTCDTAAILIAVRMVSEGFDAPDVSALAYMSAVTAPLFIAQTVARAMRVTDTERRLGRIPAEVIIPGDPEITTAFTDVLVGQMRLLATTGAPCPICGRPADGCYCRKPVVDKHCARCGIPRKICPCPSGGGSSIGAAVRVDITEPARRSGLHRDGLAIDLALTDLLAASLDGELDPIHVPAAASAVQKTLHNNPYLISELLRREPTP